MAAELCGAKLLAPYFGTSLYVWGCVMALTLGGLACGYFYGGRISLRNSYEKTLMACVLLAAFYLALLPLLITFFSYPANFLPLIPAALCGSFFVLFPPVFLMGMVSPLLIKALTLSQEEAGKRSGEIYAVSTAGGILFTFLIAFFLIPNLGISISLLLISSLLAVFPLFYFTAKKRILPLVFFSSLAFFSFRKKEMHSLYLSEGLLGKLEVKDIAGDRYLFINNIVQSRIEISSGKSKLAYTDVLQKNLPKIIHSPKSALVLGLGGGVMANVLNENNIAVTAVELDERMAYAAKKYFSLDGKTNVIIDDARHALNKLRQEFDLIIIDLFNGEVTPSHILSLQSLQKIKSLLSDSGFIFINTYGYLNSGAGKGNKILLKTLEAAHLHNEICFAGDSIHEDYRSLLIFSRVEKLPDDLFACPGENYSLENVSISTDDKPLIEFANAEAGKRWRYTYLKNFILRE